MAPAVGGILDEPRYKTRFGTIYPNLKTIAETKKSGVEFFVGGQYLPAEKMAPKSLTFDVTRATAALPALSRCQNQRDAVLRL
jgi:hypothetical protein